MELKYQNEIDAFNLNVECPNEVVPIEKDIYAYRYSLSPITHKLNFVPNVIYDREKPAFFNYKKANPYKKCKRCGASFFSDKSLAIGFWNGLTEQIRENLGYTHIAYGILKKGDGWVSDPNEESHFSYYQEKEAKLVSNFKIVDEL